MAGSTSSSVRQTRKHEMPFGASVQHNATTFNLWAPSVEAVSLCLIGEHSDDRVVAMQRHDDDWFRCTVDGVTAGQRYQFAVGDLRVPDPASRRQAGGVHGTSVVVDPHTFAWTDSAWRGRPWEETVVYELHVGTFSREGTFRGVIEKLDYLKSLGVTAIELMPLSDFPGSRNWGYDGVLHFAPAESYGSPDDLKGLIDAAHRLGIMVFLDVVYNHFGPEGNYLYVHSKPFFTERYHTPWGAAIDFEGERSETVRSFFVENALYWLNEFHFDGLRFDAVHAIFDSSEKIFLEELAESIKARVNADRHVHLILENDNNDARLLEFFTAQWNDDYHHCVHVIATGETAGYYCDYTGVEQFARVLAEGFAYQGEPSPYRDGERRGTPSDKLPARAFVSFMQNHDQIGNRAFGDRIAALASVEKLRAITAITLLAPQIPMLFMGEEWASRKPFLFFCDLGPELAPSIAEGRRNEFAKFPEFKDEKKRAEIPDPTSEQTYVRSILDWSERESETNHNHFEFVRTLVKIRFGEVVPRLQAVRAGGRWQTISDSAIQVVWQLGEEDLVLYANLGDKSVSHAIGGGGARTIFSTHGTNGAASELSPWCVIWQIRKHAKQG